MEILVPRLDGRSPEDALARLRDAGPLAPFAPIAVEFLQELSRSLLRDPVFRPFPESVALGHWLRPIRLKQLRESYDAGRRNRLVKPRGVALHFVPSNVDTVFVYSLAIALLAGNANIIRISRRRSAQMDALLGLFADLLGRPELAAMRERLLLVSYDHDPAVTRLLSDHCDVRIIWGGDEAVKAIRAVPLPPLSTEVVFGDRFSLAAVSAAAVLDLDETALAGLAERFYRDTFYYRQMACSSPRLVVWVGSAADRASAQQRFWAAVETEVAQRDPDDDAAMGIRRMATAYALAAAGHADRLSSPGPALPLRVSVAAFDPSLREQHCGGGLFLETAISDLADLGRLVNRRDQTLAVFGFDLPTLSDLASHLGAGVDRVVPVGNALDFDVLWDGYDLFSSLTRVLTVDSAAGGRAPGLE